MASAGPAEGVEVVGCRGPLFHISLEKEGGVVRAAEVRRRSRRRWRRLGPSCARSRVCGSRAEGIRVLLGRAAKAEGDGIGAGN